MRIGIWQDETPQGGIDAAIALADTALAKAKADNVDILVFPECFLTGYYHPLEQTHAIAALVNQQVLSQLQTLADTHQMAFVIGSYERVTNGIANAAFVFRPDQTAPLTYHKRALYGAWEKSAFISGRAPLVFDYQGTRFAVLICFDVEFPELVRDAAQAGAQAVLVPTALMAPETWVADLIVPTRAIENNITVAYANRIGTEEHLTFIGQSQICDADPSHRVVASGHERGLISALMQANPDKTDYLSEIAPLGFARDK